MPAATRVTELEAAIRAVCEPIFNKPLKDISFGLVLLRLFDTARQFDMEVQPQLVLLQKTLLNIEGLGRQLYPELDLWATAQPVLEEWMRQRTDPRTHLKRLVDNWSQISEDLLLLPDALHKIARRALEGQEENARESIQESPSVREAVNVARWNLHRCRVALGRGPMDRAGGGTAVAGVAVRGDWPCLDDSHRALKGLNP